MKFILLLSLTVVFVASGAEGLQCKCCNDENCPGSAACGDNGENSTTIDCRSDPACYTSKSGLKICFSDVAAAARLTEHHI